MEQYHGESPTTAVYNEERCHPNDVEKTRTELQRIFGDSVDPKTFRLQNGDPLKLSRQITGESEIFFATLRHQKIADYERRNWDGSDNPRVETVYVLENSRDGRRMACFEDPLNDEIVLEEKISAVIDQKDEMSEQEYAAALEGIADKLRILREDKRRVMVLALQTQSESTASRKQAKLLNDLLRVI